MSFETVVLIVTCTLCAIVLGWEASLVFQAWVPPGTAPALTVEPLGTMQMTGWIYAGLGTVLAAAGLMNAVTHTRSEVYLLRVGLAAVALHAVLVAVWVSQIGAATASAGDALADASRPETPGILIGRLVLALIAFWSFLHYAMNPRLPGMTTPSDR